MVFSYFVMYYGDKVLVLGHSGGVRVCPAHIVEHAVYAVRHDVISN